MRGERKKRSNRFLSLVLSFILTFGTMSGLITPETVKADTDTTKYHCPAMDDDEYPEGAIKLKERMILAPGSILYSVDSVWEKGDIQYMSADGQRLLYDPYNDSNNNKPKQHTVIGNDYNIEDFGGWKVVTLHYTSAGAITKLVFQPAKAGEVSILYNMESQGFWYFDIENDPRNPTSFISGEEKEIYPATISQYGVSVANDHPFLGWFRSDDPKEERVYNTEDLADAPGYVELFSFFKDKEYDIKYYSVSGNELNLQTNEYVDHVAFVDTAKNPSKYTGGIGFADLGSAKWDEQYGYYDFVGWYYVPDQNGREIKSIPRSEYYDISLYAIFTPSKFNIIYECGDGGDVSDTNPTEYAYGDTISLGTGDGEIKDPIANPGYVFAGWYQTPDYSDEQFTGITDTTHGDITLYAKWNTADYTITLNPAGGTVADNTYNSVSGNYVKSYTAVTDSFTLPTPAKEGYTFSGWKQGDGQAQATVTITKGTTGDKAYTAVWTPNTYQVTFNKNHTDSDGQGSMNPQSFTYDEAAKNLTENAFTRTNYEFAGWAKTATATDAEFTDKQAVQNLTTTANGNVDLYALWAPKKYNITYYGADGNVDAAATKANPSQYTYGQELLTGNEDGKIQDATPADDGYSFTGWYRSTDFTQARIEKITSTDSGDISLYAGFAPKDYSITYMVDGQAYTSKINPATYTYKTGVEELKNETKTGYTFSGWFDAAKNGKSVTAIDDTKKGNITLYGTFTAIPKYTVKFTDEDDREISSKEYYENTKASEIEVPNDPVKAPDAAHSYTFNGWIPALTDVTGPATYKATYQQEARKYTITWVDGDGKTIKQDTKEYGTVSGNFVIPDTDREPTAEYTYTFTGWEPAITDVTGDATYKATYSKVKNQYKITWVDADGNTIKEELLDYGTVLDDSIVPEAPTMESTKEYTCAFTGWEPAIARVTGDATYKATYSQTKNQFTITWVDGDGKTLKTETVAYGEKPAYDGVDPTKAETDHYTYTFNKKWSPEIAAATADATYTAQFDWTLKEGADPFLDKDNTEEDTKGTKFSILFPRIAKVTKNSVQIKWKPVEGADGYLVYGSQCNSGGIKRYFTRMAETDAGTTTYTAKKLKKASYYKFYVVAYKNTADGQEALAKTKRIHVTTLNQKTGDATDLKIFRIAGSKKKAMKKKLSLKEKGSVTIFATEVNKQHKRIKRHKAIGVESDQPDVVKVTDLSGKKAQKRKIKLTGLKKGTANVYIYAQNGLYKTIRVTVK